MSRTEHPKPAAPAAAGGTTRMVLAAWAAVAVVVAFQFWWGTSIRTGLDDLREATAGQERTAADLTAAAADLERASLETRALLERMEGIDARLAEIERRLATLDGLEIVAAEWDFLAGDIQKAISSVADLQSGLEDALGIQISGPRMTPPPALDWTEPELFEAAREGAASVGITLTAEEVRVPAQIVLRQGILEYLAVLKGGREHEALVSLHGNTPDDQRRPADLGVKLNNAIQALGFKPGRPIGFSPAGTSPPSGEPIFLFVEWEQDGRTVSVRAEDLVWNIHEDRPMERGTWVYVGSSFVEGEDGAVFAADMTGEVAATYSRATTIIDTTSAGASDDTVFVAATPRIHEDLRDVTFVIRRVDQEPTFTFSDPRRDGADGDDDGDDAEDRDTFSDPPEEGDARDR